MKLSLLENAYFEQANGDYNLDYRDFGYTSLEDFVVSGLSQVARLMTSEDGDKDLVLKGNRN